MHDFVQTCSSFNDIASEIPEQQKLANSASFQASFTSQELAIKLGSFSDSLHQVEEPLHTGHCWLDTCLGV